MSDQESRKEMVYFLDVGTHETYLKSAIDDRQVATYHLHDHTAPEKTMKNPPDLLKDLCEYVMTLEGFIKLMDEISEFPTSVAESGQKDYVLPPKDAMLLSFYIPLLETSELRMKNYGLSMAIN